MPQSTHLPEKCKDLKTQTTSLPTAGSESQVCWSGFDSLGSYNDQLTSGAKELKQNAPVLNGVKTLQKGTNSWQAVYLSFPRSFQQEHLPWYPIMQLLTDGSATLLSA